MNGHGEGHELERNDKNLWTKFQQKRKYRPTCIIRSLKTFREWKLVHNGLIFIIYTTDLQCISHVEESQWLELFHGHTLCCHKSFLRLCHLTRVDTKGGGSGCGHSREGSTGHSTAKRVLEAAISQLPAVSMGHQTLDDCFQMVLYRRREENHYYYM